MTRDARALLTEIFLSAVAGAAPGPATARAVSALDLTGVRRVRVIAAGKASSAMADAALGALAALGASRSPAIAVDGLVVMHDAALTAPASLRRIAGDHPLPGRGSATAADAVGELVDDLRPDDLVLVLLSGGTSSLLAAPVEGVSPEALRQLGAVLLASGLPIGEMNALRKRFARWGAGRLAVACAPARVECLALSDVPGDRLADIASGPCTGDEWTAQALLELVARRALAERIPAALLEHLREVAAGERPETPKPGAPELERAHARVLAGNGDALRAAAAHAGELGLRCELQSEPLTGDARAAGKRIALRLLRVARTAPEPPLCLLWGGETTVTLGPGGAAPPGGRAQELALSVARTLHTARPTAPVAVLSAGTDGRDGTTDAAGAIVDAGSWKAMQDAGLTPERALAMHEAHAALDAAGLLLRTGATGTNVMDVVVGLVGAP